MLKKLLFSSVLLLAAGCEKYYLTVNKESIGRHSLASTFAATPDPLQAKPPRGEKLYLDWNLPSEALEKTPLLLRLQVIFQDFSQKNYVFSIDSRRGLYVLPLLGQDYLQTGGFLTYQAEIVNNENKILESWQHQLWVELINPES